MKRKYTFKEIFQAINEDDLNTIIKYVKDDNNINVKDDLGYAPIFLAVGYGRIKILEYLLNVPTVDINIKATHTGWAPIHMAVKNNNDKSALGALSLLLDKKADIYITNNDSQTPLELAIECKNIEAVKKILSYLLENYCQTDRWQDQIQRALKFLSPKNINDSINQLGSTALMRAIGICNKDVVRAILDANADVNVKNKRGETPLKLATKANRSDAVIALFEARGDVDTSISQVRK